MRLTIWGARGSIPVSGKQYQKYGGDTTCVQLTTSSGQEIILDAGTGLRRMGNFMLKEKRDKFHLLLTHAHWDHLSGFPFFKPLYKKGTVIKVHGCGRAQSSLKKVFADLMNPPYFR
jgi:phosphoribosyl 1,2-cyclic phosphodiesterase